MTMDKTVKRVKPIRLQLVRTGEQWCVKTTQDIDMEMDLDKRQDVPDIGETDGDINTAQKKVDFDVMDDLQLSSDEDMDDDDCSSIDFIRSTLTARIITPVKHLSALYQTPFATQTETTIQQTPLTNSATQGTSETTEEQVNKVSMPVHSTSTQQLQDTTIPGELTSRMTDQRHRKGLLSTNTQTQTTQDSNRTILQRMKTTMAPKAPSNSNRQKTTSHRLQRQLQTMGRQQFPSKTTTRVMENQTTRATKRKRNISSESASKRHAHSSIFIR